VLPSAMAKKRETRRVIFARPEQPPGGENRYISKDGKKITKSLQKAADFHTPDAAQEFAKAQWITIDGVTRYIGQVNWPYGDA